MASNYTEHYKLNQWSPEDKVLRTEFNEDNQKIDAALEGIKNICNCHIQIQSYTGTGSRGPVSHTFPFRPMYIAVFGDNDTWATGTRGVPKIHGHFASTVYVSIPMTWGDQEIVLGSADWGPSHVCNVKGTKYTIMALLDVSGPDKKYPPA